MTGYPRTASLGLKYPNMKILSSHRDCICTYVYFLFIHRFLCGKMKIEKVINPPGEYDLYKKMDNTSFGRLSDDKITIRQRDC